MKENNTGKKILVVAHYRDADGQKIASVPLLNSDRSIILMEEDLDTLMELGVPLLWRITNDHVTIRRVGIKLYISRLIVDAKKGQQVEYIDGDPCNLRRANLVIAKGSRTTKVARKCISKVLGPRPRTNLPIIIHKIDY